MFASLVRVLVELDGLGFRTPDRGLGGTLETLLSPRGGCGKALMLTDFRSDLEEAIAADTARG